MRLSKWGKLSNQLQNEYVHKYYEQLSKRQVDLIIKRVFDVLVSVILLVLLSPVFVVVAIAIKLEDGGTIFYRQQRVTQFAKMFEIHKFRSMSHGADKDGLITVSQDSRITRVGKIIRKYRIDEIPQLIDVLNGNMTFVGTRPEVPKYVDEYNEKMLATLLLPAGITSLASIFYKDESRLLNSTDDADSTYIYEIMPHKMEYNLQYLERFSLLYDIKLMFMTFFAVCGKEYREEKDEMKEIING